MMMMIMPTMAQQQQQQQQRNSSNNNNKKKVDHGDEDDDDGPLSVRVRLDAMAAARHETPRGGIFRTFFTRFQSAVVASTTHRAEPEKKTAESCAPRDESGSAPDGTLPFFRCWRFHAAPQVRTGPAAAAAAPAGNDDNDDDYKKAPSTRRAAAAKKKNGKRTCRRRSSRFVVTGGASAANQEGERRAPHPLKPGEAISLPRQLKRFFAEARGRCASRL